MYIIFTFCNVNNNDADDIGRQLCDKKMQQLLDNCYDLDERIIILYSKNRSDLICYYYAYKGY